MDQHRAHIRTRIREPEADCLKALFTRANLTRDTRSKITERAIDLVNAIRDRKTNSLMELFLEEYGLSTDEGIALMCLAEALLRVPDTDTMDALIEDKIVPSKWGQHLGQSSSSLVNASTWALMLTGSVLDEGASEGIGNTLRRTIKRLGEPVIRKAVSRAMKEMGAQFVLGRDIDEAMKNARSLESEGYGYSYDMLGEAAMTESDAKRFHLAYSKAITSLASACNAQNIQDNPGISVKLSALFPRYEEAQRQRVLDILVPRTRSLALLAKSVGMGFNIDAEEADRLELSLDVIEQVLSDPSLADWDGFGVVVQAYGKRAPYVLDWLYALSQRLDRRIMVRLVKGAYWDSEIKSAQVAGLDGFPVFTNKCATDVSYIACAKQLLGMTDRIYPQFATHNARTVAAVLELAADPNSYEFQRLHGMGEALHEIVHKTQNTRCRIYAPVGPHKDLLAYLVRRLLENGANSSFVNQIVDPDVPPEVVAADPFSEAETLPIPAENPKTIMPRDLFQPGRSNSRGFDLNDPETLSRIGKSREPFATHVWTPTSLMAIEVAPGAKAAMVNPADPNEMVSEVRWVQPGEISKAVTAGRIWSATPDERADVLNRAADLYEENYGQIFALLTREAGKVLLDCDAELREAVDFLRYYADQCLVHPTSTPLGLFACISPWNFPVAIFTGQIAAALAMGNGVIAKPAEQTPAVAHFCTQLLHQAGVPRPVLQLVLGDGASIGNALCSESRINGVCFTGSTQTAQIIHKNIAQYMASDAPFIAETGGINAMIVDSTALNEQAVRDILASALQSTGQRCSALRCLYLQDDIADEIEEMLFGAMDELTLGRPWELSTDIGPLIDQKARQMVSDYIDSYRSSGKILKEMNGDGQIGPVAISIDSISELEREIFGPILHIARFKAQNLDKVIHDINATGYGLTFGLHTRIDDRVQHVVDQVKAGNIYVNRNQIGAIVGSQPFGGHGLSGTGPKAGGPLYVTRFAKDIKVVPSELPTDLPGPTGESNRLITSFCTKVLYIRESVEAQIPHESYLGRQELAKSFEEGLKAIEKDNNIEVVVFLGGEVKALKIRMALAQRGGSIVRLVRHLHELPLLLKEQHICIDTTASGGNASLLSSS